MTVNQIRYLRRDQVDVVKWDNCIDQARNGLIYAYSYYLDSMARNWDALVMEDYEAVMPLTWNKKYGISYLYQPPFTPSLGIFGSNVNEELVAQFLKAIPSRFKLIEISLNSGNTFSGSSTYEVLHTNYILDLSGTYESLNNNYRENIRRNLKKSQQLGVTYDTDTPISEIIGLSREQMRGVWRIEPEDYIHFEELYLLLKKRNQAISCGVYLSGQLIASAVYFFSQRKAYYILVGNHPNGKTIGASHYLVDQFIQDYAGNNLILDFEGSDIKSLAFFYSSFGAKAESYPVIRLDKLPWWIKLIRRKM